MTSKVPEMRLSHLRGASRNLVWAWIAAAMIVPAVLCGGILQLVRPDIFDPSYLALAVFCWMLCAVAAAFAISQHICDVLGRPVDTIVSLAKIDGLERADLPRSLDGAFSELNTVLVRSAHEKNGRLAELARGREQARAEGEAHARFFAGMSHELRAPLNAIIGYAMLLEEDSVAAGETDLSKDLDRILQSSRHLLRLINDLLDLSRLDAGELEIEREVIDLPGLVNSVTAAHSDMATRTGSQITTNISPAARVILGDSVRLQHCLSSLVSGLLESGKGQTIGI